MDDGNLAEWAYQQTLLQRQWLEAEFSNNEEDNSMSLTVRDNGTSFLPPPEGLHIARCYALIDLGEQVNKTYGNSSPKVLIGWELMDTKTDEGKPFIQMQRYTASLSEKSNLRALLEAWRGRSFTPEELKGFKLKAILGATCYLTTKLAVNQQTNSRWSEVISVCKLPIGVVCPAPFNPSLYFDLDEYTEESYLAVPEGIRKKINTSGVAGLNSTNPQGFNPNEDVVF